MVVKSRRAEYAESTRRAIVEAAIAGFAADGYAGTSVDAIAAGARVTKGAVYHHFADKARLFEAAFTAMEERLLGKVAVALDGVTDPWELVATGVDVYLRECCVEDFRRIALEDAPAALGWVRWKEIEERYFLAVVGAALEALAAAGQIRVPAGDLTARMLLGALAEAGLVVAGAADRDGERRRAGDLVQRILRGLG